MTCGKAKRFTDSTCHRQWRRSVIAENPQRWTARSRIFIGKQFGSKEPKVPCLLLSGQLLKPGINEDLSYCSHHPRTLTLAFQTKSFSPCVFCRVSWIPPRHWTPSMARREERRR